MNLLHALLFHLADTTTLHFGGAKTPPAYGAPPPSAKTSTSSARLAADANTPKTGRASTILSPRFRQDSTATTKRTVMGTPL